MANPVRKSATKKKEKPGTLLSFFSPKGTIATPALSFQKANSTNKAKSKKRTPSLAKDKGKRKAIVIDDEDSDVEILESKPVERKKRQISILEDLPNGSSSAIAVYEQATAKVESDLNDSMDIEAQDETDALMERESNVIRESEEDDSQDGLGHQSSQGQVEDVVVKYHNPEALSDVVLPDVGDEQDIGNDADWGEEEETSRVLDADYDDDGEVEGNPLEDDEGDDEELEIMQESRIADHNCPMCSKSMGKLSETVRSRYFTPQDVHADVSAS